MIDLSIFSDLYNLGFHPIPVVWEGKIVTTYPKHETDITDGKPSLSDVNRWILNGMKNSNGIAIKLFPPMAMLDFDIKNSKNKNIYQEWLAIVNANNPDVLRKVCIETTRNAGYHVYLKFSGVDHKIGLAKSAEGEEVISLYTGGLLSFCAPSPGYNLIHNEFCDIQELTVDEFDLLTSSAAIFNEEQEVKESDGTSTSIDYPYEYESFLLQFDHYLPPDNFETLLNSINLFRAPDNYRWNKYKWVPFLRKGSEADYSAKVYFRSNRLLLFTSSVKGFPNWHHREKMGDKRWILTPSFIIFYKHERSWPKAIEEIKMIVDSAGMAISYEVKDSVTPPDRLKFPFDVFPESIQNFIFNQTIQREYLAGSILAAVSTAIGNSVTLEAMDGYSIKPILYLAIIAPPGASKTPALKKAFAPLEAHDAKLYEAYKIENENFKIALAQAEKDKSTKPEKPAFPQLLVKDSTIEMVVKILSHNPLGCCVLADELSGFLNRMNQYKTGDEVQKWLEMWSGAPILLQRISREENKVQEPYCNVVGGIQPGVLESLSKADNEHNGFYHRFLFVYPEPQKKTNWQKTEVPWSVKHEYNQIFLDLLAMRPGFNTLYLLSEDANERYGTWFNGLNSKYNRAQNDHYKGIIAKYQDYCLRFSVLLQVLYDGKQRIGIITDESMERAIRLTDYFFANMNKAIKILSPESPVDKLQGNHSELYKILPQAFTTKTAIAEGIKLNMKGEAVKVFLGRMVERKIFSVIERGKYEKVY